MTGPERAAPTLTPDDLGVLRLSLDCTAVMVRQRGPLPHQAELDQLAQRLAEQPTHDPIRTAGEALSARGSVAAAMALAVMGPGLPDELQTLLRDPPSPEAFQLAYRHLDALATALERVAPTSPG